MYIGGFEYYIYIQRSGLLHYKMKINEVITIIFSIVFVIFLTNETSKTTQTNLANTQQRGTSTNMN